MMTQMNLGYTVIQLPSYWQRSGERNFV